LGFKVVLKGVSAEEYASVYSSGDYDVIGLDYQMLSAYPLYSLAPFAKAYSGRVSETDTEEGVIFTPLTHISGYYNEAYDALIAEAFEAENQKDRAAKLHEAEELLIKDAPVVPVIFNSDAYVTIGLSDVEVDFWGSKIFTKTYLNDYVTYLTGANNTTEQTEEPAK
ncbi:MAG: hypothetical protein ACI4QR_00870, partial [Eubacteriales bacterium]